MNKSITNYNIVTDKISIEKYNSFCYFKWKLRGLSNDMELINATPKITECKLRLARN